MTKNKPYSWVPSLYLAEALPFTAVMSISVLLFRELGLADSEITLYTGWLGLPWVIKPLWSPFVDNLKTERWWILVMQFVMGVALALVAFTIPGDYWLQATLAIFMLIAFASSTHDISADGFYILALEDKDQELYVGVRNTFYRIGMVIGQGTLVMLAGALQNGLFGDELASTGNSWAVVFGVLGVMMVLLSAYHSRMLPHVTKHHSHESFRFGEQLREFANTLNVFIRKPYLVSAIAFILLFRLPEGLLTKIVPLFLTRGRAEGGLGLDNMDYGFISGTLGVIGLLAGGIIGGWAVSRWGLKKCLWPLVLSITLPDAVYVYMSALQPDNLWVIGGCLCFEQLGYGLGFAAYTLYLVTFSRGERSTAVFSICTAGQYLGGVMIPGMVSGFISESVGYEQFFLLVMAFCLVTFAVTACVKIAPAER